MDENFEVEVPCDFLCPISLQLMKDPVTLITYDRDNIEKWLFSFNNKTCPVINQQYLTPNHTLRRLIQSWCNITPIQNSNPQPPLSSKLIPRMPPKASILRFSKGVTCGE